ncbi:RHS repeat domain-containing protein [Diaphorobacter aerolatus]|uniref:RHS repeat domain-containing protein n=1 Tax=Diaphorobacter aerolatus TaxID=1288495 RepID=UPI001D027A72|nr:RHS repeat-associated core domain-containing protein [Diaphorobacter aerolatus]
MHGNVIKRTKGNQSGGNASVTELHWNADHQLTESRTTRHGLTQSVRYAYDALGRRVSKTDAFGTTQFLWDGDLMVHSQRGVRANLFIYEPGSFVPLATVQGTGQKAHTYWYQCDQIGAPQELTDAHGRIVWAADYKVWGESKIREITQRTGTDGMAAKPYGGIVDWYAQSQNASKAKTEEPFRIDQPFRFQGQQSDEETGLHYNRFRYYDPGVGRFVSQDPIGLLGAKFICLCPKSDYAYRSIRIGLPYNVLECG